MSSIIKGLTSEQDVTKTQPEVAVPGYGTMPLDMLKRHVQTLSKEFNDSIQQGEFLKAAYRTEQFYNALMALAKALKQQGVAETTSTGTVAGSAGIGGGAGLGIDKSPIEKVIEKPLGETIQSSQGGMGQAYRKFTPKAAGVDESNTGLYGGIGLGHSVGTTGFELDNLAHQQAATDALRKSQQQKRLVRDPKTGKMVPKKLGFLDKLDKWAFGEEQAPMFTPEEKMVNANDPRSDGWKRTESAIMKGLQTEAGGITRWSKENPPPPELLLNTLIQILMNPANTKSPQDLISLWNEKYGLQHTLGGLRQYAQNDYKKAELSKALTKAALAYESSEGK
jgi:hypothetical protein